MDDENDPDYSNLTGTDALRLVADHVQVAGMMGNTEIDPEELLSLGEDADAHWMLVWADIGARMTEGPDDERGTVILMQGACAYKARHDHWPIVNELMQEWAYWTRRIAADIEERGLDG